MKTSLVTVALAAAVSSLVTVGVVELLRSSPSGSSPARAVGPPPASSAAPAARAAERSVPASRPPASPAGDQDRLAELERRLAALELDLASRREPVSSAAGELPQKDELRDLVLEWVAADREARGRAEEREQEEEQRTELEFDARFSAHMLAEQHDLAEWEEDRLAEVLLEIEVRRKEVDESFDPTADDPAEIEARYVEFDEWAEGRLLEELGQELIDRIEG